MKSSITAPILLLIAAVLADTVAGPAIVGKWVGLHFTAAAVAYVGLRHGKWAGLAAGWSTGMLMASLSTTPFGLCMMSLGLTGVLGGLLRRVGQLDVPVFDVLLVLGLMFFEDASAGLTAWALFGVRWHPAFLGVPLTMALFLLFPHRRRRRLSRRMA